MSRRQATAAAEPAWLDRASDYPFESRYLEIDGHTLHYVDEGEGPPLLFLHANPLWSFYFRRVIAALRGEGEGDHTTPRPRGRRAAARCRMRSSFFSLTQLCTQSHLDRSLGRRRGRNRDRIDRKAGESIPIPIANPTPE